jgi:DnaJ-class molecular chaperone
MITLLKIALFALIVWGGWKVGLFLMQKLSKQKVCDYCEGKGYWLGTRDKNFCKKCNGTGLLLKKQTAL